MTSTAKCRFVIEKLRREHDLSAFHCSNSTLNDWLKQFAWTNRQADSANTYLVVDASRVVGYCALTAASVLKQESPRRIAQGLANHPVGVVLLARLAVDESQQGGGLGKALLYDALTRIEAAAGIAGVRALLVHAIDEPARRFYLHFGFEKSPVHPFQLLVLHRDLLRAIAESS